MELLEITGGTALQGEVRISGAKNSVLPIMAAALAMHGPTKIQNVPQLVDVSTMSHLLQSLGMDIKGSGSELQIQSGIHAVNTTADYELVRRMRAGICVLGPLLARYGHAVVSLPGGCNIGHRPVDLHMRGLQELGAKIHIQQGYIHASAQRLRGTTIDMIGPLGSTVTGTCNVMTAACLAQGTTVIKNAATEPEITDLGRFLQTAGANITGLGTKTVTIIGVEKLSGCSYTVMPDRIEAATYAIAAVATRGSVVLQHAPVLHMQSIISCLREMNVVVESQDNANTLSISCPAQLHPVNVVAAPHPNIPTDCQAQLMALLATINGQSQVTDTVFQERFMHVSELNRMGARIECQRGSALIYGGRELCGANVMASDLRASAALVIAALAAKGISRIHRIYHLDRGYERLDDKLRQLGATIVRRTGPRT